MSRPLTKQPTRRDVLTILLDNHEYSRIHLNHSTFDLTKLNYKVSICRDCMHDIQPRMGIQRKAYTKNGYICFSCFSNHLRVAASTRAGDGDLGFRVNAITHQLQVCNLNKRQFTTVQILQAVAVRLMDLGADQVDALLGDEVAHPWSILDAAEAYAGI